jgi:outer membrane immunogenic protein
MKKVLLGTTAIVALAVSQSFAADLPVPPVLPAMEPVIAPAYSWTGPYIGISVGGYWRDQDHDDSFCDDAESFVFEADEFPFVIGDRVDLCILDDPGTIGNDKDDVFAVEADDDDNDDDDGFLANLHAGFNWQAGNFVFGPEGEIKFFFGNDEDEDEDEDVVFAVFANTAPLPAISEDAEGTFSRRIESGDWLALATLRAGALFGSRNQLLGYIKGGLAVGDNGESSFEGECEPDGGDVLECEFVDDDDDDDDDDDLNVGFTIGGGLEYKLTQNFSIGAEYLFVDLEDDDEGVTLRYTELDLDELEVDIFEDDGDDSLHLFEVRATFHFGGPTPGAL